MNMAQLYNKILTFNDKLTSALIYYSIFNRVLGQNYLPCFITVIMTFVSR